MMEWSSSEEKFLQRFYSRTSNNLLAAVLGRSRSSVNHKALRMDLGSKTRNSSSHLVSNGNRRYDPYTYSL